MNEGLMREAIRLAMATMEQGTGGPFGALVVRRGEIVSRGWNQVTSTNDPTAHAEVMAIREACRRLNTFRLDECDLYASCEPCPMCLGAIYWARLRRVFYGASSRDAAAAGFDDQLIYQELAQAARTAAVVIYPAIAARGIGAVCCLASQSGSGAVLISLVPQRTRILRASRWRKQIRERQLNLDPCLAAFLENLGISRSAEF